ncbi:MAG: anthranilate phosphoribosyltransferase [Candidatus Magnetoovum sp. WYHC-5]|nr:anthranilate phosphoribosyltransferase [Candidatus Magnetoovum sp. WYHC-5]
MIKEAINILVQGIELSEDEMTQCMNELMEGKATDAQIGAFLTALRMKGESVQEITAAAKVMKQKAAVINAPEGVLDTCGTGGDMSHTFNISTTAALIIAACRVPVAKHGNRSVSSLSGSADILEALGVVIELSPRKVEECLFETGFGFLFAPRFHPAMKYAVGPRREMSIRTIFNILGPITNPAGAKRQLIGVFADRLTTELAHVLNNLGVTDALVVHGEDGLDEITITDGTKATRLKKGSIEEMYIAPEDFNFRRASLSDLYGGDKYENAKIALSILDGERGPRRDIVIMNAAAGLLISGKYGDLKTASKAAQEAIDSGLARQKLEQIKKVSAALYTKTT